MNKTRRTIFTTDIAEEQIHEIALKYGFAGSDGRITSPSNLFAFMIAKVYEDMQPPAYARSSKDKNLTTKDRVALKNATRKAEQDLKHEQFVKENTLICEALHGEVIDNGGSYECKFQVVDRINSREVIEKTWTRPFGQLSTKTVEGQFRGQWTEEQKDDYRKKWTT